MTTAEKRFESQIQALVKPILGFLHEAHPSHTKATYRAAVIGTPSDPDFDPESFSIQGAFLEAPHPPVIRQDSKLLTEKFREFYRACHDMSEPIKMVEIHFSRAQDGWSYEAALETLAAYEALQRERAPLDQEMVSAMVAAATAIAGDRWDRVTFDHRLPSPAKLLIMYERERQEPPVPAELQVLLKQAFELYSRYGRKLYWPLWRVKPKKNKRNKYDIDVEMYYG